MKKDDFFDIELKSPFNFKKYKATFNKTWLITLAVSLVAFCLAYALFNYFPRIFMGGVPFVIGGYGFSVICICTFLIFQIAPLISYIIFPAILFIVIQILKFVVVCILGVLYFFDKLNYELIKEIEKI